MLSLSYVGRLLLRGAAAADAGVGGELPPRGALRRPGVVLVAVSPGRDRVPARPLHLDPTGRVPGRPLAGHAGPPDRP